MGSNDFSIKIDSAGKSVIVEFWIEEVIADWWLTEIRGNHTDNEWDGRTDDDVADAVPIDASTLDKTVSLGWTIVLFGPAKDTNVDVTVDVRQDGALLGQKQQTVTLKAKKAQTLAGTISIQ